jgi:4'-phosphopantetheinyl transferase
VTPREWTFSTNAYGRPQISNSFELSSTVRFNISHTHSLIVLAMTRDREVGVDVENVEDRTVSMDIADRFFAPEEAAALAQVPGELQQERFFEYWTFKESYIKARGMGLSLPLEKFAFHYPGDRLVRIAIHADLMDDPHRWHFWQLRPTPKYLLAVCAERLPRQALPRLIVRQVVPMRGEQLLAPDLHRISE